VVPQEIQLHFDARETWRFTAQPHLPPGSHPFLEAINIKESDSLLLLPKVSGPPFSPTSFPPFSTFLLPLPPFSRNITGLLRQEFKTTPDGLGFPLPPGLPHLSPLLGAEMFYLFSFFFFILNPDSFLSFSGGGVLKMWITTVLLLCPPFQKMRRLPSPRPFFFTFSYLEFLSYMTPWNFSAVTLPSFPFPLYDFFEDKSFPAFPLLQPPPD